MGGFISGAFFILNYRNLSLAPLKVSLAILTFVFELRGELLLKIDRNDRFLGKKAPLSKKSRQSSLD